MRKAARAIEDKGPHRAPAGPQAPQPAPPPKAHAPGTSPPRLLPPGSQPGSSTDTRTFAFGGPVPYEKRGHVRNKEPEQFFIGDRKGDAPPPRIQPTGKLVKEKTKTKKSAGVSQQVTVPDHTEKLTKHGKKKIVTAAQEESKPEPHVEHRRDIDYGREKRKGAPQPPKTSILRKRPLESGPVPKKRRRVSAHQV